MKIIAFYYSDDIEDEEYLDLDEIRKRYHIFLKKTNESNWGGETIFEINGSLKNMNLFAQEICGVDDITDLENNHNVFDESLNSPSKYPMNNKGPFAPF